jgi:hypothetical protein
LIFGPKLLPPAFYIFKLVVHRLYSYFRGGEVTKLVGEVVVVEVVG